MKIFILSLVVTVVSFSSVFAQSNKADITETIATKHSWLPSVMVDNFVTVNLSKEFYDKMMAETERPMGIKTLNNMGIALYTYLDAINGTSLNKMCGFSVNGTSLSSNKPICEDQIKENKGKISVTINSGNIRLTEDSYKLLFVMGSTVNEFLNGAKYNQSTGKGWKPKGKTMAIIINSGKTEKDLGAKWNIDFTVCTITTSPYVEVPGWSDKIKQVLNQGVVF
jgi:hypothetical protein